MVDNKKSAYVIYEWPLRQIVKIFRQIQCIYAVAEDKWKYYFHFHYSKKFPVCYDSEVFQDSFIGDKLTENIQKTIKLRRKPFLRDLAVLIQAVWSFKD